MVTKIKGPIVIKKGDLAGFIKEKVGDAKLPFKATGWKSTENEDKVKE